MYEGALSLDTGSVCDVGAKEFNSSVRAAPARKRRGGVVGANADGAVRVHTSAYVAFQVEIILHVSRLCSRVDNYISFLVSTAQIALRSKGSSAGDEL